MSECNHDCGSCSENCDERTPGSMLAKLAEGSRVKKVIGVISGKGGVGKSMVTSQLAVTMQRRGHRTAILDADITGPSIPKAFGLKDHADSNGTVLFPVQTKSGIQVMKRTPCCGAAPSSAASSPSSGPTCCGTMWTICSSICPPAPATWP